MPTFREGDTIEIPYLLQDDAGDAVSIPAGATVTLLLAPQGYGGPVADPAHSFELGTDSELSEESVTIGSESGNGLLFSASPQAISLPPDKYEYHWQVRGPISDDEVGTFVVLPSATTSS